MADSGLFSDSSLAQRRLVCSLASYTICPAGTSGKSSISGSRYSSALLASQVRTESSQPSATLELTLARGLRWCARLCHREDEWGRSQIWMVVDFHHRGNPSQSETMCIMTDAFAGPADYRDCPAVISISPQLPRHGVVLDPRREDAPARPTSRRYRCPQRGNLQVDLR